MTQIFKKFAKNKYNSKVSSYNGRNYHSALECNYAIDLDWRVKAGEIKSWENQYKIDLTLNGVHICNYFIDFKVTYADGHVEYHEVKGFETDVWRIKWKLSRAIYPDYIFVLIK